MKLVTFGFLILVAAMFMSTTQHADDIEEVATIVKDEIKKDGGIRITKTTIKLGFAFIDGFVEGFTEAWTDPERKKRNEEHRRKLRERNNNLMNRMNEQVRKSNEIQLKEVERHIREDEERWEQIQKNRKENLN